MFKPVKTHLLIIVAHPDDESFLFAGTSLKFLEEGKNVAVVCATRGEKGDSRLPKPVTEKRLAKIRERELRSACRILGIKSVKFLEYEDGRLVHENFDKLVRVISKKIDQMRPEIIATFGKEGITGHNDHITIGKTAVAAAKKAKHKAKKIWLVSNPASIIKIFNKFLTGRRVHRDHYNPRKLIGVPDERLTRVNIRKYWKKKLQAIKAHKSQIKQPFKLANFPPEMRKRVLEYEYFEVIDFTNVARYNVKTIKD